MVEQEQGEQSSDLRVVDRRGQLARQPDRLRGEVDVAAVALVEYQVERPQHGAQIAGAIQSDFADGAFGAADPLGHRGFRHEVRLRDLAGGEAADGPQRQGDGGRRREARVRAQEVQLQRVIGGGGRTGWRLVGDQDLAPVPGDVGSGEVDEAPPRRGDQPALGVVGEFDGPRPPVFEGPDQRLLDGVFGGREVGPAVDEGRQDAGDQLPELGLRHPAPRVRGVNRVVAHYSVTVVGALMNGRTSSHSWIGLPPAPGAADNSPASSTARS